MASWNVSSIGTQGFVLNGVLDTSPNGGGGGVWGGGGALSFDPDESGVFYFETGNGLTGAGNPTLDANGFPVSGDYFEAVAKAEIDPTTSPTNQNINGWGFKIVDYFIPYNMVSLDDTDEDLGSGSPLILPDSAGIPGHPHLLVAAGKQGKIYVIDRDNMSKFNPSGDNVLNSVPNGDGTGVSTPTLQIGGSLSTPTFYNGTLYWVSGYNYGAYAFQLSATGLLTQTSQTTATFGYLPGSVFISAQGTSDGIVWVPDRNTNELHAFDASTFSTELWNSNQKAGGGDAVGSLNKFAPPTVANGEVYVGTAAGLVVYGLTPPANAAPAPPVLNATALSGDSVNLTWADPTTLPNTATGYLIEESLDDVHFTQITTAPAGATSLGIGGLTPLTTYNFRIRGYNSLGDSGYSNVASATTTNQIPSIDLAIGFANSSGILTYNGSAALNGSVAQLTDGGSVEAGSVFTNSPLDVSNFSTEFRFLLANANADGFTFTIQTDGPTALGSSGGSLGYGGAGGIPNSLAIKFDLYDNMGEGSDSTGLFTNGASPTNIGSIDLSSTGINFRSGDPFDVVMTYDGTTLSVVITDLTTNASASQSYGIDIPATIGSSIAYVGFTGGTGGLTAIQDITSWTFAPNSPQPPNAPSALGAVPATATSVTLAWTTNSPNDTGFYLDRATDPNFTNNLITQTLPAGINSYTDTANGLAPGSTFYYRIRAFNLAGSSANSNVAGVMIPLAPPKPTNALVVNVTTSEIELSWNDNSGPAATYFDVLRSVNGGAFTDYLHLPSTSVVQGHTLPAVYEWADTGVAPGNLYEYHIEAVNSSGYNDFVGANAETITLPPTNLGQALAGNGIALTWTAPPGIVVSYNVYRGASPGGEGTTPFATGITGTTFLDSSALPGVPYYYTVTAVNDNINHVPALPSESAPSNEAIQATQVISLGGGFAGAQGQLALNGSAALSGNSLQLTDGQPNEAASAFFSTPANVTQFNTQFTFQLTNANADGFTFTIQTDGATALGSGGGSLGYGPNQTGANGLANSLAVKFDLYDNQGEGNDSTGLYIDGATPTNIGSIDLSSTGINFHSGDIFQTNLNYDGATLTETITDTQTNATVTEAYPINIEQTVGSATAFVGFTAGTGGLTATQDILSWTYSSGSTGSSPVASELGFGQQPSNATAGVAISPAVTVKVEDVYGNVVTSDNSTVTLTLSGGTFASGASTATATASNGVATFSSLVIDTAGSYTLAASDGSLTGATSNSLTISPTVASALFFGQQPSNATAGVAISPAVTVEVEDGFGNVVTSNNSTVTLTLSSGLFASGSSTASATATNGVATFSSLVIDAAGSYTLAASEGSLTGATSNSLTISPTVASKLVFGQQPSNATAGVAISPAVTVKVEDVYGNVVTSNNSTVTLTLSGGTFAGGSSTASATASNGVATFSSLIIDTAGSYTLAASDGALAGATSNNLTISPTVAGKLVFGQQPSNAKAGVAISPAVTVKVEDVYGNVVASNNSTVTLTLNSGTFASGSSTATATATNGLATFSSLIIDTVGSYTLTASDGALTGATSNSLTISPPVASKLVFGQQPSNATAGVAISPAVTVRVEDVYGNVVTGNSSTVTLKLSSGTFASGSSTASTTASNGVAAFSSLVINMAGSYTLKATDGSLTSATSNSLTISPTVAGKLVFGQQPSNAKAGAAISPAVTVKVEDVYGNVVTSNNSTVTLTLSSGTFASGSSTATASNGVATFSGLVIDLAGSYTLKATDGSLTSATSNSLTINPAAASKLVFGQQPSNAPAGVAISPAVTVKVEDVYGNVVTSNSSTVTLKLSSGTFASGASTATATATSGLATFSGLVIAKTGTYTLKATDGSLTSATSNSFTIS